MNGTTFAFSESTQPFIDEQVGSGRFASANEFVENLVEQARKHAARERVDQLLLRGLDSGPGIEVTPEWWRNKADEWAKELVEGA
jgi:Arc/MetJ-type ribon-helix-helix transcriptional regulator